MNYKLMCDMKRGLTRFAKSEQLTSYPSEEFKTPGIIATPLFNIYTPISDNFEAEKLNVQKAVIDQTKEDTKEEQVGLGAMEEEPLASGSGIKRKIDTDVLQKMMHPTFKISKLTPKKELKKEKAEPKIKSEQSGKGDSKRKIFKF